MYRLESVSITGTSSEEIDQVASGLANRFELYKWILGGHVIKEPIFAADRLDLQIIQELRYDARLGVKSSESLAITPGMVEYRIKNS
jgi:hypothetical protein